jgi:putative transposase
MSQSLANIIVPLIFSTKERFQFLHEEIQPELNSYLASILKDLKSPAIKIGSVTDHVHLLFRLSKNLAICDAVEKLKTGSSKWIKRKGGMLLKFHWQNGYGAFSVSQSNVPEVVHYIEGQKEHHQTKTFQEEYRSLLVKYQIPFDEHYVWD